MTIYAVKKGLETGIFENWTECQKSINGFSGAEYKSFKTREEAEAYLENIDLWEIRVSQDNEKGFLVAFTDGSFNEQLKRYSYGVILITPEGKEEHICGYGSNEKYLSSNNIIGEIFGVINALDWAVSNNYSKIKIYHDYEGLAKWVSGEWKANKEASKLFVSLLKSKYEDLIEVIFEKVPGHSNISFNERADRLADSALIDRKKVAIKGAHWYSIPYFSKDDFEALAELVLEADINITYSREDLGNKFIYRFKCGTEVVVVTLFNSANHKLLVQGKNTYLFQVIATTLVELEDSSQVDQIMGSAYRISIDKEEINTGCSLIERGFPVDYPENIKRLIRQAVINLKYSIESEDYSQYAFPALRALEGHIKYLIITAGGNIQKTFSSFNRADNVSPYYYTGALSDLSKKASIENCYNYYKAQRDTAFHFGDILGSTDSTRIISSKDEADEIINKCLSLINENI